MESLSRLVSRVEAETSEQQDAPVPAPAPVEDPPLAAQFFNPSQFKVPAQPFVYAPAHASHTSTSAAHSLFPSYAEPTHQAPSLTQPPVSHQAPPPTQPPAVYQAPPPTQPPVSHQAPPTHAHAAIPAYQPPPVYQHATAQHVTSDLIQTQPPISHDAHALYPPHNQDPMQLSAPQMDSQGSVESTSSQVQMKLEGPTQLERDSLRGWNDPPPLTPIKRNPSVNGQDEVLSEAFMGGNETSPLLDDLIINLTATLAECSSLMNIKKKIPEIRTKIEAFFESARRHRVPVSMIDQMHAISVDLKKYDHVSALDKYNRLASSVGSAEASNVLVALKGLINCVKIAGR